MESVFSSCVSPISTNQEQKKLKKYRVMVRVENSSEIEWGNLRLLNSCLDLGKSGNDIVLP